MGTLEKVTNLVAEQCGVSRDSILPSSNLVEDLDLDSLAFIELILEVEDGFGIDIPADTENSIKTIQDVVNAVENSPAAK